LNTPSRINSNSTPSPTALTVRHGRSMHIHLTLSPSACAPFNVVLLTDRLLAVANAHTYCIIQHLHLDSEALTSPDFKVLQTGHLDSPGTETRRSSCFDTGSIFLRATTQFPPTQSNLLGATSDGAISVSSVVLRTRSAHSLQANNEASSPSLSPSGAPHGGQYKQQYLLTTLST
jgi:hypothetical protein